MASLKPFLAVSAVILLNFVPSGVDGIKCYQCNSAVDPQCETLQKNETYSVYFQPCRETANKGQEVFCRKIIQYIKDVKETMRVIRKCGWEKQPGNKDCYKFEDDDHREIVCQCFSDGCNSAPGLAKTSLFGAFLSCVAVTLSWRISKSGVL